MEKGIKRQKLPNTNSIQELAAFWDTHDLTNFEQALEEVRDPVFVRSKGASLSVDLPRREVQRVKRIAKSKGVNENTMLREWILERLHQPS
jgi:predicted DNA binding CopG/RHH family protein